MNQRLPQMPKLEGEVYAPVMPKWAANLLRLLSLGFSVGAAGLGFYEWHHMPIFARVIVVILSPAMMIAAIHPKGWATLSAIPFFLADKDGLYFKHKMSGVTHLGGDAELKNALRASWLFVPWKHISNFRIETVRSNNGFSKAGVLDVVASDEELKDFFGYWIYQESGEASVAFYANTPPAPRTVVNTLKEMMAKYKNSLLREKYERAR